jgi:hypothetical protein
MNNVPVQVKFVSVEYQRPPTAQLFFDITLANLHNEARWFLLPDEDPWAEGQPFSIDSGQVYELIGQGRVIVGHFRGTHGVFAISLPANAHVLLRNFPIGSMNEYPSHFNLGIITASRMLVDGMTPEDWIGTSFASDKHADVSAEALSDELEVIHARETTDFSEVEITLSEARLFYVAVKIQP